MDNQRSGPTGVRFMNSPFDGNGIAYYEIVNGMAADGQQPCRVNQESNRSYDYV